MAGAMTDDVRLTLRLPKALAAALRQRAAAEQRSLNKEIVFLPDQAAFPTVDADAYRDARGRLIAAMPRYALPRPFKRRPRRGGGTG